ncbi:hypothetical protein GCK72_024638 [Caenorhabditis remanei]|uniref:Glycosyl hydrolase family 63 C-terminal domain-containing protein n=1 Tax=Caenorhabditis remanei TaxID=31234 RepID=A0A6A5G092_CAERE|nr:hypothetical protein GCK72_024638 [Caenorhabditis remanei]KAF1748171.1 hypothetical protein GCK72_024638 [Caenorhabditis remanei]
MVKKVIEPGNSQQSVTEKTSADTSDGKKSTNEEKKPVKTESKQISSLSMPKVLTAVLTIGFFLSIAGSYGYQSFIDTYIKPPLEERTFPFLGGVETNDTRLRNVYRHWLYAVNPILHFLEVDKPWNPAFIVELSINDKFIAIQDFDTREYDSPDVYNGGKMTLRKNHITITIFHIIYPNATIGLFVNTQGRSPNNTENNLKLKISGRGVKWIEIPLLPDSSIYQTFPNTTELPYKSHPEMEKAIGEVTENWKNKFDKWFTSTGQQQIPKAYLELINSAYSLIANSLNNVPHVALVGKYETWIEELNYYFIARSSANYSTLDEQFFPLLTLSRLESEDTMRVLNSWMSLVNNLGYMGNRLHQGKIHLTPIQGPLLFQVIKDLLTNPLFEDKFQGIVEKLEYIAEYTWKNSIGKGGLTDLKWLGDCRGIFQYMPPSQNNNSSFELLCLLGDMSSVMQKVYKKTGAPESSKWVQRSIDVENAMKKYWNEETKQYGDLVNGKWHYSISSHVPLILASVKQDAEILPQLFKNLQQDTNFTTLGIQLSEEEGAAVSTNYFLLKSLKHYSELSGPSQETAHQMYSVLKNNMAAAIARANRIEKSFYGNYDRTMRPIGLKDNLDGTLVFAIMSS